jgi:hypothetical protein
MITHIRMTSSGSKKRQLEFILVELVPFDPPSNIPAIRAQTKKLFSLLIENLGIVSMAELKRLCNEQVPDALS